jgi:crossover junction endodeoxyribonuclease RuvC
MHDKSKIILGIDPGTIVLGYGLIEVKQKKIKVLNMGVIKLAKLGEMHKRLARIYSRIDGIINEFNPDEVAIEAQFFGKDVQAMLKLGRAQGVAITPAVIRDIPVFEYAPRKIKVAITGNGDASKEQVALMLGKILKVNLDKEKMDATDGLAAALCHYYQSQLPSGDKSYSSWEEFAKKNPGRIK